jgi:hypothetical protein
MFNRMPMKPWPRLKGHKNMAAAKTAWVNFLASDHAVILLFWSVILTVAGFLLITLWHDYGQVDRRAQQRTLTVARLVTDNVSATFRATDIVLHHVLDSIPGAVALRKMTDLPLVWRHWPAASYLYG